MATMTVLRATHLIPIRKNDMILFSVGSVVWWFILAVVWIAIAFWPARVAGRKGHSFLGYFVLSLVFFPLALVLAYIAKDRAALA
jgi:hypothetical protein